ncbi:MAG: DUF2007 domain-containing protein [Deltaproteobacteria bacterium]|nr:DUF2007 domain-containing protein [Deltaproteobacteria bacterium]
MVLERESAVVVATFPNRTLAALAASVLEVEGIESFILADDAGGSYPMLQFLRGVKLLVAPDDEERAREILAAEVVEDPEQ